MGVKPPWAVGNPVMSYFSVSATGQTILEAGGSIEIPKDSSVSQVQAILELQEWQAIQQLTRVGQRDPKECQEFSQRADGIKVVEALIPIWKRAEPIEAADANQFRLQVLLGAHRKRTHVVKSDESVSAAIFQTWLSEARLAVIDDAINGRRCVVPNRASGEGARFSPALENAVVRSALTVRLEMKPEGLETPTEPNDPFLQAERSDLVDLVRGELLPRYQLDSAWRVVLNLFDNTWRAVVMLIPVLFGFACVAAFKLAKQLDQDHLDWYWLVATGLPYLALVAAAVFCPFPGLTDLFCLRMPASVGLGFAALLTAGPAWVGKWESLPDTRIRSTAPFLLIGSALGYLLIEARINGSGFEERANMRHGRWIVIQRASLALAFFCIHSICIIALALAVPARLGFLPIDSIPKATDWFLPTAASLALVLGLLAQTLWDDAAITTPIGRTTKGRGA
jgi:hypothetical protein